MTVKKPALPICWYSTPAEIAYEWGVHPDRVMYYADAGLLEPGVLVPKAHLPMECPGPAPHVCVLLHDYLGMTWEAHGADRIAPLVGEFRAFQVDGEAFRSITLRDCDLVVVSRSDLVIPLDQREAIEAMGAAVKPINPTERNTLLCIIGWLLQDTYPDIIGKPYAMAERISAGLSADGIDVGPQAVANKINAARALIATRERETA